jgi:hypothetical protein
MNTKITTEEQAWNIIYAMFSSSGENPFTLEELKNLSPLILKPCIKRCIFLTDFTMSAGAGHLETKALMEVKKYLIRLKNEIDTKSKEKEAEEKRVWLAKYESERGENFTCPHNNDL